MEAKTKVELTAVFVTLIGIYLGFLQFIHAKQMEAQKPYLEKKLEWCTEAVEKASAVANAGSQSSGKDIQRFWQLYWGVMGMIEEDKVTKAMINFGDALKDKEWSSLKHKSLEISHACKVEMAKYWNLD